MGAQRRLHLGRQAAYTLTAEPGQSAPGAGVAHRQGGLVGDPVGLVLGCAVASGGDQLGDCPVAR
jgi:hypothetical protein